jgi:3-oxoacyl-ACP reductase-like protein
MSIFSKIMDAISWKGTRPTQTGQTPKPAPAPAPAPASPSTPHAPAASAPSPTATTAPASQFDVEANLAEMAQGKDLNWRTSIVDLMKLLGIDSSLANRKELAQELGYTGALDGSAEMNIWLHKATMRKLAQNGGKVPASMLD